MFTEAVSAFDSKFMLGLSATPYRRDRLTRLIYWNLGDRLHEIEQSTLEATGDVLKAEVITRETDFVSSWDASERYSQMLSELTEDRDRNEQIIDDVVNEARKGSGVILIISDRRSHCETLSLMLSNREINSDTLTGDLSNGTRKDIVERLNAGQVKVLIATGQLIGEGFDCKSLSTLFLACPIKFSGRLIQYLGRVLRPAPGKNEALVYDYVDSKIGVLENAARARQRVYAKA
jgi:superfamily II DNA or RNA helicase